MSVSMISVPEALMRRIAQCIGNQLDSGRGIRHEHQVELLRVRIEETQGT